MIIRHSLPTSGYTKIDRNVFSHEKLSDGAKVLYGYLCSLRCGANMTDAYIMKALNLSLAALGRRKRELRDQGLILVDQISPRVYAIYIGHTKMNATAVKHFWQFEDGVEIG